MSSTPNSINSVGSTLDWEEEDGSGSTTIEIPTFELPTFELLDHETFDQLLEMDDDEDHDFSRSIVWNYFDQAKNTFDEMDRALDSKDLNKLSQLGHFLKGSSAAIGVTKVKASCEKIQHFGNKKDEAGTNNISEGLALKKIEPLLKRVKEEYKEAEDYLRRFYQDRDTTGSTDSP
ncbi:hypothetical protein G9A89_002698 [Geosiphon pyriformis]|nr:hypothetical protein G9A89_002698 [Geosiphon pyriformis]